MMRRTAALLLTIATALAGCGKNEPAANPKGEKINVPAKTGNAAPPGDNKAGDAMVEPKAGDEPEAEGPVTVSGIWVDWERDDFRDITWKLHVRAAFTLRSDEKYFLGDIDVYTVCAVGGKRMGDWSSGPSETDPGTYRWESSMFTGGGVELREKPSQCQISFRYSEDVINYTPDKTTVRTVCAMDTKIVDGPCPALAGTTHRDAKGQFVLIDIVGAKPKEAHPGYVLELDADITLLQKLATLQLAQREIWLAGRCKAGGKWHEYKRTHADAVRIYGLEPGDTIPVRRSIFKLYKPLPAQPTQCEMRFDAVDPKADNKVVEQSYFCWREGKTQQGRCK